MATSLTLQELYDENFYRSNYPELANLSSRELYQHFLTTGITEARNFSPFFNLSFYDANNPDLSNLNNRQLIDHFLNSGLAEDRKFSQYLDLDFYRANNPDLQGLDNVALFKHFQNFGINEKRRFSPFFDLQFSRDNNPSLAGLNDRQIFEQIQSKNFQNPANSPFFDADFYRRSNPDLAGADIITDEQLFQHFQNFGLDENRKFSPYLDLEYYLKNNPDLATAGINTTRKALNHFEAVGLDEGRPFSQFFDVRYYLDNNPDLRAAGISYRQAFTHFQNFGVNEGRRPSLLFNPSYYLANNPDLAATGTSFKEAFKNFQLSGFQGARLASIFFNPNDIAPVVSPNRGTTTTGIPDWLQKAAKWGDIPANGTLTYSFVTTASAFLYDGTETGVSEIPDEVKNNIRNIIRQYDDVLGINLVEVPDRPPNFGRIRIMYSQGPAERETIGYANQPSDSPGNGIPGDIHLDPTYNFAPGTGSYSYEALLFLVGAALGLDDYTARRTGQQSASGTNPQFPLSKDNNTNTVMTKNVVSGLYNGAMASTPMPYDIRALQYLYGASYLNNGDTTYSFNLGNFFGGTNQNNETGGIKQTIWDAGGSDTLDFSAMPANVPAPVLTTLKTNVITPALPSLDGYYLDMNEGGQLTTLYALNRATYLLASSTDTTNQEGNTSYSAYNTSSFNTNIAFGFELENLIGSPGIDVVLGNNLSNKISTGAGDDNITGAGGADTLTGGSGNDTFVFARGDGGSTAAASDVITDFTSGQDKIALTVGLPFRTLPQPFSIIFNIANRREIRFANSGELVATLIPSSNNPNDTILQIASTNEYLALVQNNPMASFNASDFIAV